MKKLLTLILALCMCLSLVACGSSSVPQSGGTDSTPAETTSSVSAQVYEGSESPGLSVETGAVYEGNDVKISVIGAEETASTVNLSFSFESESDLDLSFCAHAYAVNGVMADNNIYDMDTTLPAGKKANNTLEISKSWMQDLELGDFEYADILFWAYDDAESMKSFETDIIRVKSDTYDGPQEYTNEDKAYDEDGIEVGGMFFNGDEACFSVINNKDSYFSYDMDAVSVNGYGFDAGIQIYDRIVFPCSLDFCSFRLDDDFKKETGESSVRDVEFMLNYRLLDDYFNEKSTGKIAISEE